VAAIVAAGTGPALADSGPAAQQQPGADTILTAALNGPLAGCDEIIFAQRVSGRDHWYGNFGHYCENDSPYSNAALITEGEMRYAFGHGGRLCRLNLRTGKLQVLLDDPASGVRDPDVHYDGGKILFSYRRAGTTTYHLYEINADGTNLRQLTDGPDNDIEPIYTPDGGIVFCSSRCHRFVPCWRTQVAILYRCDGDGGNIRMLSNNSEQENTPWMLPDGRILYMRSQHGLLDDVQSWLGRRRPEQRRQSAAPRDRQFGQPVDEADRRQPLRGQALGPRTDVRAAVDRIGRRLPG